MKIFCLVVLCLGMGVSAEASVDLKEAFPSSIKCISLVAPSSHADNDTVRTLTNKLSAAGFRVKVVDSVWNYSRDAAVRARDFEKAWCDPETDLVLCTRGGRGGYDTVTNLNFNVLRSRDVPFVGFSNISTLMNAFVARGVRRPITGPTGTMLIRRGFASDAGTHLAAVLAGAPLKDVRLQVRRAPASPVSGKPIGGHWPSISQMSSPFLPNTEGRIAFLEINKTYTYAMATNSFDTLKQKGYFKALAAAVLCDIGINGTSDEKEQLRRFITDELTCPVFSGFPYGHTGRNYAIDFDRTLTIAPDGLLTWANK